MRYTISMLGASTLLFFSLSHSVVAADESVLPPEIREFMLKWNNSLLRLEEGYKEKNSNLSAPERLVRSFLESFPDKSFLKGTFDSINLSDNLKKKILKDKKSITYPELRELLSKPDNGLSPEDNTELLSLLLLDVEKKFGATKKLPEDQKDAQGAKSLIEDQLSALKGTAPKEPIVIASDAIKKFLGLDEKEAKEGLKPEELLKRIKEKGLPPDVKDSLALLGQLINKNLENPEAIGIALAPLAKQIFNIQKSETPPRQAPEDFLTALKRLIEFRSGKRNLGGGAPPSIGGGGGQRFNKHKGGKPSPSYAPTPEVNDTPELKACLDAAKDKDYNVPVSLPGALCASTAIAKDPDDTTEKWIQCALTNPNEEVDVDLGIASHCVEGMENSLSGHYIGVMIGGQWSQVGVASVNNPDGVNTASHPPIEGGNPDLSHLKLKVPCSVAMNLTLARIPSPKEVKAMRNKEIMTVLKQNQSINASAGGENKATIVGTSQIEENSENRKMGNFVRFNSNSNFNITSHQDVGPLQGAPKNVIDSNRIKPGDSGGTMLACHIKEDKQGKLKPQFDYLAAISYIDVTGTQQEGQKGGGASGNSLLNLSKQFWPDSDSDSDSDALVSHFKGSSPGSASAALPHI